ncbi:ribose-phosphate pyrophosphokinase [Cryptococcus deuterogattii 99/473]|uniref:ribose-phosphate diphosphokinase n=1 Tax=Cryptococcus deuterogattii Ram5 TaxID=1296110 RepID=A0A0D0V1F2_9TREE|nr:ribose-phosphate pyrophosphokinase [Cryptococcus deuterogattii LA55]KIR34373.1 ribose-phosphate pyrophosphokinase [Cryptococcus deuterogattii MMRL2647]KIR41241.1 ribose-phosphate pyrophosphokinase [Cryptococcus deuterogattii Ram5]KIR70015.1 ribose-phosphate pyrophosphokinase [Cryptococcus deuterogattii CA1014]KIR90018.1 ribose-phosphate pyrophosphokinase [Cryptococcus deuterogattii CBS 10090]KIR98745.1 ribose-phosphate pyrophosphokinase [Cryptococcus deuterogattii 2001/935-1]KIY56211.1 rib
MHQIGNSIKLLTGNAHPKLAEAVAARLGIPLTPCHVSKFRSLETSVQIHSSVRDEDVFILQSPSPPDVNDHLMELLILISACKTASAKRITAHVADILRPYVPIKLQPLPHLSHLPYSAIPNEPYRLVANLLAVAGADHVITMDLHASQIQGFFDIPVDNLFSEPTMMQYIKSEIPGWREAIIVSPDAGGAKRATALADQLNLDFALINRKRRRDLAASMCLPTVPPTPTGSDSGSVHSHDIDDESNIVEKMELLVGDVKGKVAILIDDMIDTGHTVRLAAGVLRENGAKEVYALVSHGLLSDTTMENLSDLPVKKLIVTNSIDQTQRVNACNGLLETLDIAPVIAESIRRTHNGESISALFRPHDSF